jgi:unsaturated rhamnogalacturonyl hydrolase
MDISCSLRDQLAGLKPLQTENGLWHTVLDDMASYEELSASCGIAAAMLINGNPLHTTYAQLSFGGIMANISQDGRLLNVSGGTAVMRDLDGYRNISRDWTQGWGQGLALAFLIEVLESEDGGSAESVAAAADAPKNDANAETAQNAAPTPCNDEKEL